MTFVGWKFGGGKHVWPAPATVFQVFFTKHLHARYLEIVYYSDLGITCVTYLPNFVTLAGDWGGCKHVLAAPITLFHLFGNKFLNIPQKNPQLL